MNLPVEMFSVNFLEQNDFAAPESTEETAKHEKAHFDDCREASNAAAAIF